MKSFATFLLGFAALFIISCKNDGATAGQQALPATIDTTVTQLETTKQAIGKIRTDMVDLNAQLNALPESIKEDPAAGYSDILHQLQILDSKTIAMVTAYEQIIPELETIKAQTTGKQITPDSAQALYNQVSIRFTDYDKGLASMQYYLKNLQDKTAALVERAKQ
jgi:hypothetical protein